MSRLTSKRKAAFLKSRTRLCPFCDCKDPTSIRWKIYGRVQKGNQKISRNVVVVAIQCQECRGMWSEKYTLADAKGGWGVKGRW